MAAEPQTGPASISTALDIGNRLGLRFRGSIVEFGADVTLPRSYVCLETQASVAIERARVRPCLVPYVRSYPLPFIFADFGTRELPFLSLAPAGHVLGTQRVKITLVGIEYRSACALQLRKVLEHAEQLLPETWYGSVEKNASSYVVCSKVVSGLDWLPGSNS